MNQVFIGLCALLLVHQGECGKSDLPDIPGANYVGCYRDGGSRDLGDGHLVHGSMSLTMCLSYCQDRGTKYFGTQHGANCFCGDSYGSYGEADNCDVICAGNHAEQCGGGWANSLYEITEPVLDLPATNYIGCYVDKGNRDLAGAFFNYAHMTPDLCNRFCSNHGSLYFGLQAHHWCFCGDSYDAYGTGDGCTTHCGGQPDTMCGGGWRNSVYEIVGAGTPPAPDVTPTATAYEFSANRQHYILETATHHQANAAEKYCRDTYGFTLADVDSQEVLDGISTALVTIEGTHGALGEIATGERSGVSLDVAVTMEKLNPSGWNCATLVSSNGGYSLVGKKCAESRAVLCQAP